VPQGVSAPARAALWLWAVSVAASPASVGEQLTLWRFASSSRPKAVTRALRALKVVKGYSPAEQRSAA
jgi:hypothetical protein